MSGAEGGGSWGNHGFPHVLAGRATRDAELVLGVPDPLLQLPAVGGRVAGLDPLELRLRGLELRLRAGVVDLLDVHRVVDERERAVELDLEKAGAGGELEELVAAEVHTGGAGLQRG